MSTKNTAGNGKYEIIAFIFLVVFLCAVKIPVLIDTDIQPWDEGMYATRVLSIAENGDFFDQSSNSVGKFYSGSHPPLLIWTGYFVSMIFGLNNVTLKLLIFILSLLSLWMIFKTGEIIYNRMAGLIAAVIFSSNIIFNIFSKRFQFDIPYTLLILLAFYFFLKYNSEKKNLYLYAGGIFFGLCLMIKILVGFYIPAIIFITILLSKGKNNFRIKELAFFTLTGIIIALPWHIYMFVKYGNEFIQYFFFYHIFERALFGVEHNTKGSGYLYFINYLLSILPYGIIILAGAAKKIIRFRKLKADEIFLLAWFLTGFIIITLFKTKLEVYILLILTPGVLIGANYLQILSESKRIEKFTIALLTFLNTAWSVLFYLRTEKGFKFDTQQFIEIKTVLIAFVSLAVLFAASYLLSRSARFVKIYTGFILLFFIFINILYRIEIPYWENSFTLTEIKQEIESSGRKDIIYIASDYRYNPQFSFYFKGLNLGWDRQDYSYMMMDTKGGTKRIKSFLETIEQGKYEIIVERNGINRGNYPDTKDFIPDKLSPVKVSPGYILYSY